MKKLLLLFVFAALASVTGAQTLSTYGKNALTRPLDRTDMCLYNTMPSADCLAGGGLLSASTLSSSSASSSLAGVPLVRFQSYINVGAVFQDGAGGPIADVSFGARVGRCFYAGLETGFGCVINVLKVLDLKYVIKSAYVPVALNLKGYIPLKFVRPYLNCSLGGFFGVLDMKGINGFYCQPGIGIDIFRFSLGVGYCGLLPDFKTDNIAHLGYVKLGVRIGGGK